MGSVSSVKKATVLIIESSKENAAQLSEIISPHYNVVCASDKNGVLSLFKDDSVSAAIIDIPNALSVLTEIRHDPLLEDFPVLVSVAENDSFVEDQLLDLGVIDFLKKPFAVRSVLSHLKIAVRLFEANRVIDELERDDLTGLFTRPAFLRKSDVMRRKNPDKTFAIIGFDFDNFKMSNTLYGEEKCDEFLAYTAHEFRSLISGGIIGRFGGDQFVLFIEYKDKVDADKILKISRHLLDSAPIPHQTVKIGIYAPVDFSLPIVICSDRAFLAIRDIKGIYGKDISFYENKLQKQLLNEKRIIETMETALEEEQFEVYYQPKHETITGKIAGAEALVRWNHPEFGFMSPGQFIPLFERNGFITRLDNFILDKVCSDIKRWQKMGLPVVPVSANVSRRDFMENNAIDHQVDIINGHGIDHSLLHMEVTESLYSENTDLIISQVKKIQKMGFSIEMDDFGSGYSSLGLLSTFPLDILKLDISFVRNIKENEIVIENVIKMAHRMGLLTIAEGVESSEQFKTLKTLGCDFIQGFYFSKPLTAAQYEAYLKNQSVLTGGKALLKKVSDSDYSSLSDDMLMAANEVAEGIPGGFFSYHADGNLEIISFNHELMDLYDCETAEEFRKYTGNSFKGIVFEEDFERVQQSIESQITPENDLDYAEYRIKSKNGTIKNVRDYGRFVHTEKYGDVFYVFVRDITEEERKKKLAEEDRQRKLALEHYAEIAERTNKAKNIFMYNIARDIMPSVKEIISATNKMRENTSKPEIISPLLDDVRKSEENMLSFINNILTFTKLETGEIELVEIPTDFSHAVEYTYALIEKDAKAKNIKVEYWSDITNPYIYQDPVHTAEVVSNILRNAIKYTPEGGTVRFGIEQTPGRKADECIVSFICEDTGIGISEEFLPNAFRSFSREDNEINRAYPSAGLGLNIAKTLILLMHGSIEITSKKGKGTKVKTSQPHRYAKQSDIGNDTDVMFSSNVRL
ncbi:MAG: EAL domain-containing protein [Spirochaetaceae bacterium]|nr:EAL domain-containing protein [Spirochaetaceae bacterium]